VNFVQRVEGFEDTFVGVGVVEFVLAIVVEEVLVGFGEEFFGGLDSVVGGEGAADEHEGSVADVFGDELVGEMGAVEFFEGGIDRVAEVLRGVDESAVEIEDEEFETLHGHRTEDADHEFSVMGELR
jgi:hypothetical protein